MKSRAKEMVPTIKRLLMAICILVLIGISACQDVVYRGSAITHASSSSWAEATLSKMTLREKIGQMFAVYVYGDSAYDTDPWAVNANRKLYGVDNASQIIQKYHVGSIIYFTWTGNIKNAQQVARLSNGIQRSSMTQRVPVPTLISTDQEGGIISRLPSQIVRSPGNMALGAARDKTYAFRAAYIVGKELRALGINQNLAPDADVNINPFNPVIGVRSFGDRSWLVARLTAAQVRGYQSVDVAATAKHFPGHGDTNIDSHTGLPVIRHTQKQLEDIDLPPFRAAIDSGVDVIMSAHIVVPSLDPSGRPATLSKPILTGLLRQKLGFKGVIMTDSLEMAGVRQMFPDSRVPVEAIKAGADLLLMPPDLNLAINSVVNAVERGEISVSRINASVLRILELKARLGLPANPYVDADSVSSHVKTHWHILSAADISNHTITIIRNSGVLPLKPNSGRTVLVTGWGDEPTIEVAAKMSSYGVRVTRYSTGDHPSSSVRDHAVYLARQKSLVVVLTRDIQWDTRQRELVKSLIQTGKPVIVLSVELPYDLAYVTSAKTYVATYSYNPVSLRAAVRVMFGKASPVGKLPVRIPKANAPQETLYPFGYGLGY